MNNMKHYRIIKYTQENGGIGYQIQKKGLFRNWMTYEDGYGHHASEWHIIRCCGTRFSTLRDAQETLDEIKVCDKRNVISMEVVYED